MTLTTLADSATPLRLGLAGSLDIEGSQQIEKEFLSAVSAGGRSVIVDLSGVTYLASFGMRLLVQAYKALDHAGKKLVLLSPQPEVRRVLDAAGLTDLLVVTDDEAVAVASAA